MLLILQRQGKPHVSLETYGGKSGKPFPMELISSNNELGLIVEVTY